MAYQIVGESAHEVLGLLMLVLIGAHALLNRRWFGSSHKGRKGAASAVATAVTALAFVDVVVLMASGIAVSRHVMAWLPPLMSLPLARSLHLAASHWGIVLLSMHAGMNASRILGLVGMSPGTHRVTPGKIAGGVALIAAAAYGAYQFGALGIPRYLFLVDHYASLDFGKPAVLTLIDYLAVAVLFALAGSAIRSASIAQPSPRVRDRAGRARRNEPSGSSQAVSSTRTSALLQARTTRRAACALGIAGAASLVFCGFKQTGELAEQAIPANETTPQPTIDKEGEDEMTKPLVAFFSLSNLVSEGMDAVTYATPYANNTQTAAEAIAETTDADVFRIETVQEWPQLHSEASHIAGEQQRRDERPALTATVEGMDGYDTLFLGFPIWWYSEPMSIRSFVESYDLSGKTIAPFCTTMSVGIGEAVSHLRDLCPQATVLDGLTLRTASPSIPSEAASWAQEVLESAAEE
ncbi:MAG: flavodoxin [Eggerthellaceae bacterium]|nr:flavodoxin [Eggerthellaceae bacterium]